MQQRGRVHEFHCHGELDVVQALIAAHPGGGDGEHGADALAAGIDEVAGELGNQFHMALGFFHDQIIDQVHVLSGEAHQLIQRGCRFVLTTFKRNDDAHKPCSQLFSAA